MPKYNFKCIDCDSIETKVMSIPDFLNKKTVTCDKCQKELIHQVGRVTTKVEQSKDQILLDLKEDVRKTLDKIKSGDEKTILDVYGERPNPYK